MTPQKVTQKRHSKDSVISANMNETREKFLEIELQETLESFRVQFNILIQMIVAIVGANVLFFGYSLQLNKALVICVGAIFPISLLAVLHRGRKFMMPVLYSGIVLESQLVENGKGLLTTFLSHINGPHYVVRLLEIAKIADMELRHKELSRIPLPLGDRGIMRIGSVLAAIAQIAIGLSLWLLKIWPPI